MASVAVSASLPTIRDSAELANACVRLRVSTATATDIATSGDEMHHDGALSSRIRARCWDSYSASPSMNLFFRMTWPARELEEEAWCAVDATDGCDAWTCECEI